MAKSAAEILAEKVSLFKRVFDNPDGQAVLAEMKRFCFIDRTTAMCSAKSGTFDSHATLYNEGKRVVLIHILDLIDMDYRVLKRIRSVEELENERAMDDEIYNT